MPTCPEGLWTRFVSVSGEHKHPEGQQTARRLIPETRLAACCTHLQKTRIVYRVFCTQQHLAAETLAPSCFPPRNSVLTRWGLLLELVTTRSLFSLAYRTTSSLNKRVRHWRNYPSRHSTFLAFPFHMSRTKHVMMYSRGA